MKIESVVDNARSQVACRAEQTHRRREHKSVTAQKDYLYATVQMRSGEHVASLTSPLAPAGTRTLDGPPGLFIPGRLALAAVATAGVVAGFHMLGGGIPAAHLIAVAPVLPTGLLVALGSSLVLRASSRLCQL